jgi:hypothetical protein
MQAWKRFFRYVAVAVGAVLVVAGCSSRSSSSSGSTPVGTDPQFHPIAIANGPTHITVTTGSSGTSGPTQGTPPSRSGIPTAPNGGGTPTPVKSASPTESASDGASPTESTTPTPTTSASPTTSPSTEPGLPVTVSHAGPVSSDPFTVNDRTVNATYSFDCTAAGDSGFKADLISGTPDSPGGDDKTIADFTGISGQGTMPSITLQDTPGSYFIEVRTATSCTWQISLENG